ncbi:MAG: hypothetical protein ACTSP4_17115 [Candidatus Hodarchaeales archaeon]
MLDLFNDALSYLQESLRTYVTARHITDKLLATQLVVISLIMSSDALILNYYDKLPKKKNYQPLTSSDMDTIHIENYRERVVDLELITSKHLTNDRTILPLILDHALDILEAVDMQRNLSALLSLNFKEFLNSATLFILAIKKEIPFNESD